jgi:ribonuclease E
MSRQRLRAGVVAGSTVTCPHCNGQGIIRSTESAALRLLRALDEEGQRAPSANLTVKAPPDVTIYTLNQKRREIARIEEAYNLGISFEPTQTMMGGSFEIDRTGVRAPQPRQKAAAISVEAGFREHLPEVAEPEIAEPAEEPTASPREPEVARPPVQGGAPEGDGQGGRRRRRRRRRGGRGRGGQPHPFQEGQQQQRPHEPRQFEAEGRPDNGDDSAEPEEHPVAAAPAREPESMASSAAPQQDGNEKRRRRRRRGRRGRHHDGEPSNGAHRPSEPHGEFQSAPQEHSSYEPRTASALPERVEPNAPSSPQWSLSEHRGETHVATSEPERAPSRNDFAPSNVSEPVAVAESAEAEAGEPREARKGWWQRRFKM